jgi:hypothetical protein
VAYNQIIRGINEEITGVADRRTVEAVPRGAAEPTTVIVSGERDKEAQEGMQREFVTQPTVMLQDNASLVKAILPRVTNKGRQLRRLSRYINHIKGQINDRAAKLQVVGSPNQPANSISKELKSPTTHLRETIRVQGSQDALDRLIATAKQMAKQRRSQRRGRSEPGDSEGDSATDESTHRRLEEAWSNRCKNKEGSREGRRARRVALVQAENNMTSKKRRANGERTTAGRPM